MNVRAILLGVVFSMLLPSIATGQPEAVEGFDPQPVIRLQIQGSNEEDITFIDPYSGMTYSRSEMALVPLFDSSFSGGILELAKHPLMLLYVDAEVRDVLDNLFLSMGVSQGDHVAMIKCATKEGNISIIDETNPPLMLLANDKGDYVITFNLDTDDPCAEAGGEGLKVDLSPIMSVSRRSENRSFVQETSDLRYRLVEASSEAQGKAPVCNFEGVLFQNLTASGIMVPSSDSKGFCIEVRRAVQPPGGLWQKVKNIFKMQTNDPYGDAGAEPPSGLPPGGKAKTKTKTKNLE